MIVPVEGGFKIKSHITGRLYPKIYSSREAAQNRIDQMEKFKNMDKSLFVILKSRSVFRMAKPKMGESEKARAKVEKESGEVERTPGEERFIERTKERQELEKAQVRGHWANIKGKRVWVHEYSTRTPGRAAYSLREDEGGKLINALKSLLEKVGVWKKNKGLLTDEQKNHIKRVLKEAEPKIKQIRDAKQRQAVRNMLGQLRAELAIKQAPRLRTKDGKDVPDEVRARLSKKGYGFDDLRKMTLHEMRAIYYSEEV